MDCRVNRRDKFFCGETLYGIEERVARVDSLWFSI